MELTTFIHVPVSEIPIEFKVMLRWDTYVSSFISLHRGKRQKCPHYFKNFSSYKKDQKKRWGAKEDKCTLIFILLYENRGEKVKTGNSAPSTPHWVLESPGASYFSYSLAMLIGKCEPMQWNPNIVYENFQHHHVRWIWKYWNASARW